MSIADQISVITALSQLNVIKLVRGAMQAADAAVAAQNHGPMSLPGMIEAGQTNRTIARDEARFEEHQIGPSRRAEGRPAAIYHMPRPAARDRAHAALPCRAACPPAIAWAAGANAAERPEHQAFTLQPPWKVLPWPVHVWPTNHFKPAAPLPDIQSKGMLIDLFV